MAAMLERNGPDGKPSVVLPSSLTNREVVKCSDCSVSYTLAYGAAENRVQEGQNVPTVMRRRANELIAESHPSHLTATFVWGGIKNGWLDKEQATAAGL